MKTTKYTLAQISEDIKYILLNDNYNNINIHKAKTYVSFGFTGPKIRSSLTYSTSTSPNTIADGTISKATFELLKTIPYDRSTTIQSFVNSVNAITRAEKINALLA